MRLHAPSHVALAHALLRAGLTLALLVPLAGRAAPEDARAFVYEGFLERDGAAVTDVVAIEVALAFDDASAPVATELHAVDVVDGRFAIVVGDAAPLDDAVYEGAALFLGLTVDGTVLEGRQRIFPLPFATRANLRAGAVVPEALHIASADADWAFELTGGALTIVDVTSARVPLTIAQGAPTDALHVAASGDIGMGTESPAAALHVRREGNDLLVLEHTSAAQSTRRAMEVRNNGSVRVRFTDIGNGVSWDYGTSTQAFVLDAPENPGAELTLSPAGNLTITGTLTQNSDARLKRDVLQVGDALARLRAIRGVTYVKKAGDGARELGVLAQEVEPSFPEAVRTDAHGTKSVAYTALVAPLLEAVKQLDDEGRAKDARIDDLTARLERLEEHCLGAP